MKPIGHRVKVLVALIGLIDLLEGAALAFFPERLGAIVWPAGHIEAYDARLYAAPYLAIALAALLVVREADWARIRIVFPPAIFFTAFMLGIALFYLNSADGFHTTRLATWLFLVAYAAALVRGIVIYWRYERSK